MKVKVFRSNYTSRPSRDLQNFVLISSVVLDIEGKILTVRQQKKKISDQTNNIWMPVTP